MTKIFFKKLLAVIAMLAALTSGVSWLMSADLQLKSLTASASVSAESLAKLIVASAELNQIAAVAALVGGVCVAFALMFED